jgi:hypothetical protein
MGVGLMMGMRVTVVLQQQKNRSRKKHHQQDVGQQ